MALQSQLARRLAEISSPCFDVVAAVEGVGPVVTRQLQRGKFVAPGAMSREQLFRRFPGLKVLWSIAIRNWRKSSIELIDRFQRDRKLIAAALFGPRKIERVRDLRLDLSEPHGGGRTVVKLILDVGSVIYKPRSGFAELEWNSLLRWANSIGFVLEFKAPMIISRGSYSWAEFVPFSPCRDQASLIRFYRRLGAMGCLAHLLGAVDCHRDNLIAAGEYPILVDSEALIHPWGNHYDSHPATNAWRTGFTPTPRGLPGSKYPSSVLCGEPGPHNPLSGLVPNTSRAYRKHFQRGFAEMRRLCAALSVQQQLEVRLRRLVMHKWRWIPRSTTEYREILSLSVQPDALRSVLTRDKSLLGRLRKTASRNHAINRELRALRQFDIPLFRRKASLQRCRSRLRKFCRAS